MVQTSSYRLTSLGFLVPENSKFGTFQTRKRDLVSEQICMLVHYLNMVNGFTSLLLWKELENGSINSKLMRTTPNYFGVVLPQSEWGTKICLKMSAGIFFFFFFSLRGFKTELFYKTKHPLWFFPPLCFSITSAYTHKDITKKLNLNILKIFIIAMSLPSLF